MGAQVEVNRNVAIYGTLIIDTSNDDYVYPVDAVTGKLADQVDTEKVQINIDRNTGLRDLQRY